MPTPPALRYLSTYLACDSIRIRSVPRTLPHTLPAALRLTLPAIRYLSTPSPTLLGEAGTGAAE
eukprot:2898162-Rhodomonas_salina.1